MIETIIVAVLAMALIFAMIAIRLIFIKDGEFRGTCSTNNPLLREKGVDCEVCHGDPDKCASTSASAK